MAEKDAFGRDQGEDPLAAMGWDDSAVVSEPGAVATAPPPAHERAVGVAPGALPGAPRGPRLARALVAVVTVFAFLALVGAILVPRIVDAVQSLGDELEDRPFVPKGADEPDATPPAGLQRGSLLRRENLVPALRRLEERSGGGRVRLLRIASDRIDAQVITAKARLRNIQHRFTGETEVLSDTSSPGMSTRATFAWSEVNALAPRRITQRTTRGTSSRELSYLVLLDAGELRWSAFLADGTGFTATADGRGVRRIGG